MKFLKIMFDHFFSLLENRDGHLAGLIKAKPEVLRKIYPYRKDKILYLCKFSVIEKTFFSLHVPFYEELGKICPYRKDVTILYSCKFSVGATVIFCRCKRLNQKC